MKSWPWHWSDLSSRLTSKLVLVIGEQEVTEFLLVVLVLGREVERGATDDLFVVIQVALLDKEDLRIEYRG